MDDRDFRTAMTDDAKIRIAADEAKIRDFCAARELTVGELLDRRIEKAERLVKSLYDLKNSLPGQYLNSGASRISAFIEL